MPGLKSSRWAEKSAPPVYPPQPIANPKTFHIVTPQPAPSPVAHDATPSAKSALMKSRWASEAPPQPTSRPSSSASSGPGTLTPTSSTGSSAAGPTKKKNNKKKKTPVASPTVQPRGHPGIRYAESTAIRPAGGVGLQVSPFGASAKEKFERFLLIVARLKWKHPFLQRAYEQAMAVAPSAAKKDGPVHAKGLAGSIHRRPGGSFAGELSGRVGNVVGRIGGNLGGGLDGGKEHDKIRFGGGFGGGFGGEVNWADDVEEDLERQNGKVDNDDDHYVVHRPVEPQPVEMFKLDFFEYYNLLERAVVHILAIFSESVQRTAVGANHSFHQDVISSLRASPSLGPLLVAELPPPKPLSPSSSSSSPHPPATTSARKPQPQPQPRKNTALDAFITAKTLRNRWKFADMETDDRTLRGGVGDLESLDFEDMLNRIFGFFDRAYELVLECNRQQRLARHAEKEKPVDIEVDMGEVGMDHDAVAANMQAWDFLDSAMDWEAI